MSLEFYPQGGHAVGPYRRQTNARSGGIRVFPRLACGEGEARVAGRGSLRPMMAMIESEGILVMSCASVCRPFCYAPVQSQFGSVFCLPLLPAPGVAAHVLDPQLGTPAQCLARKQDRHSTPQCRQAGDRPCATVCFDRSLFRTRARPRARCARGPCLGSR